MATINPRDEHPPTSQLELLASFESSIPRDGWRARVPSGPCSRGLLTLGATMVSSWGLHEPPAPLRLHARTPALRGAENPEGIYVWNIVEWVPVNLHFFPFGTSPARTCLSPVYNIPPFVETPATPETPEQDRCIYIVDRHGVYKRLTSLASCERSCVKSPHFLPLEAEVLVYPFLI